MKDSSREGSEKRATTTEQGSRAPSGQGGRGSYDSEWWGPGASTWGEKIHIGQEREFVAFTQQRSVSPIQHWLNPSAQDTGQDKDVKRVIALQYLFEVNHVNGEIIHIGRQNSRSEFPINVDDWLNNQYHIKSIDKEGSVHYDEQLFLAGEKFIKALPLERAKALIRFIQLLRKEENQNVFIKCKQLQQDWDNYSNVIHSYLDGPNAPKGSNEECTGEIFH